MKAIKINSILLSGSFFMTVVLILAGCSHTDVNPYSEPEDPGDDEKVVILLSENNLSFDFDGDTKEVTVIISPSAAQWKAESSESWAVLHNNENGFTVTLSKWEEDVEQPRTALITVSAKNAESKTVSIEQTPKSTEIKGDLFIDELIGDWYVLEMAYHPEIGFYENDHQLWMTRIDDNTIQIDNLLNYNGDNKYGTFGDRVTATVDNDKMTMSIAYQKMSPTWADDSIFDTYLAAFAVDGMIQNAGRGFSDLAITEYRGGYLITPQSSVIAASIEDNDLYASWIPFYVSGNTVVPFGIFYCDTYWFKGDRAALAQFKREYLH